MIIRNTNLFTMVWCILIGILMFINDKCCLGEVIYAINAGGEAHKDRFGIKYERDPLMNKIGTASDYGKQLLMIGRVGQSDEILYQTERYHHSTFGYDIPISQDGEYVLVLKFCEVYFNAPNMKVFDVILNHDHTVVSELDIFDKVGKGIAHDEHIPFSVARGKLYWNEEESDIRAGKIRLDFIKGYRDNPKINAFYVFKGNLEDIEPLPQLSNEQAHSEEIVEEEVVEEKASTKSKHISGPKQPNPYSSDDSTIMLPVFVAIGAFIPVLFCLCRL